VENFFAPNNDSNLKQIQSLAQCKCFQLCLSGPVASISNGTIRANAICQGRDDAGATESTPLGLVNCIRRERAETLVAPVAITANGGGLPGAFPRPRKPLHGDCGGAMCGAPTTVADDSPLTAVGAAFFSAERASIRAEITGDHGSPPRGRSNGPVMNPPPGFWGVKVPGVKVEVVRTQSETPLEGGVDVFLDVVGGVNGVAIPLLEELGGGEDAIPEAEVPPRGGDDDVGEAFVVAHDSVGIGLCEASGEGGLNGPFGVVAVVRADFAGEDEVGDRKASGVDEGPLAVEVRFEGVDSVAEDGEEGILEYFLNEGALIPAHGFHSLGFEGGDLVREFVFHATVSLLGLEECGGVDFFQLELNGRGVGSRDGLAEFLPEGEGLRDGSSRELDEKRIGVPVDDGGPLPVRQAAPQGLPHRAARKVFRRDEFQPAPLSDFLARDGRR